MKYRVFWDLGDLDCRDSNIQKKLGMSMNQILNANEEYLEKLICRIYGLPLVLNLDQLNSIKNRSYKGFKIYHYCECP